MGWADVPRAEGDQGLVEGPAFGGAEFEAGVSEGDGGGGWFGGYDKFLADRRGAMAQSLA